MAESDDPGRDWDEWAARLRSRAKADGEPTRWFEELWSKGSADEIDMPWDRTSAYPPVVDLPDGRPL